MPHDQVRSSGGRSALRFVGLERVHRSPCPRSYPAASGVGSRSLGRWRQSPSLLLFDDPTVGSRPDHRDDRQSIEIVKLRDLEQRHVHHGHTPDARRFLHRNPRSRQVPNGRVQILKAAASQPPHARFIVLHDGRIHFEGTAAELRASPDRYLQEFLFRTVPPW